MAPLCHAAPGTLFSLAALSSQRWCPRLDEMKQASNRTNRIDTGYQLEGLSQSCTPLHALQPSLLQTALQPSLYSPGLPLIGSVNNGRVFLMQIYTNFLSSFFRSLAQCLAFSWLTCFAFNGPKTFFFLVMLQQDAIFQSPGHSVNHQPPVVTK